MVEASTRRALQLFALLLDYPEAGLAQAADECLGLVDAEATGPLHEFRQFVTQQRAERLEEIYTGVFELNAVYYPYVGYHLFGETYKRSVFLLGLRERYAANGFAGGTELADHLVEMLRFAAQCDDAACVDELLQDALLPALEKMTGQRSDDDQVVEGALAYRQLLRALQLTLQTSAGARDRCAVAGIS
jgi:nitrate reductase delta subunit